MTIEKAIILVQCAGTGVSGDPYRASHLSESGIVNYKKLAPEAELILNERNKKLDPNAWLVEAVASTELLNAFELVLPGSILVREETEDILNGEN